MVASLFAVLLVQAQPMLQTAPQVRTQSTFRPRTRRQKMIADGNALLDRARTVQAGYRPGPGQPSKADLDNMIDQIKSDVDSMSEMGEMESLRLQMAMDRMSKMMSTLSNLLKKISDTQQAITQNIK